jgi:hypothetical protein
MRRLTITALFLALLILSPGGCGRWKKNAGPIQSVLLMGDPHIDQQLTRGVYGIEARAWRWAAKDFVITLRRPTGAEVNGANLQLKVSVPEVSLSRLGPITLSGKVNNVFDLAPETLSQSGDFTYSRDIPANALSDEVVTIEFTVDKAIPPEGQDSRELAIIVSYAGLTLK